MAYGGIVSNKGEKGLWLEDFNWDYEKFAWAGQLRQALSNFTGLISKAEGNCKEKFFFGAGKTGL